MEYSFWPSAAFHRPVLILCTFWFLSNRQPSFHKIIFLDTCQKMVSTHAPQFRNNLFCSEITPTSIQSHSSYPVHTAYPVQLGKTLLCPWPFAFYLRKPNAPIHFLSFYLPRQIHKNHPPALHRQQASISYNTSPFLFPAAPKNPRFSCSNGGHQAS